MNKLILPVLVLVALAGLRFKHHIIESDLRTVISDQNTTILAVTNKYNKLSEENAKNKLALETLKAESKNKKKATSVKRRIIKRRRHEIETPVVDSNCTEFCTFTI